MYLASGGIAQLGERLVRIQEVRGSNPLISTRKSRTVAAIVQPKNPLAFPGIRRRPLRKQFGGLFLGREQMILFFHL